jgi:RimJ/RimL family protein N-acetyltransferase
MTAPAPERHTLHTPRLLLRPPDIADFEPWAAMMADIEAARFIGGVQAPSVVWRGIAAMRGSFELVGYGMFSVIEKASGRWIGRIGPWRPHGWPGAEVGWGLSRDAWGKGYALEAAIACMDHAVDALGWGDIIHTIDPANAPSIRLAQKLGSTLRGPVRMPPPFEASNAEAWGQTAEEWRNRRRQAIDKLK